MMEKQVMIVVALLILMALSSTINMVTAAELGPGNCYDGCATGCVQPDAKKTSRCERKCAKKCGRPGAKMASETGA